MKSATIKKQETLELFKATCPNFYTESVSGLLIMTISKSFPRVEVRQ
jgi:hypothetical protein